MVGTSTGAVIDGLIGTVVSVEADVSNGLPQFHIVGLPDSAVSESKLRIRSAMKNSGLPFPHQRITVNLSPASMRKRGAGLDLAIAIAILRAQGFLPPAHRHPVALCGELSLSGDIVPIPGVVTLAMALRRHDISSAIVSVRQQHQCIAIPGFSWHPLRSLKDVVDAFTTTRTLIPYASSEPNHAAKAVHEPDFAEVRGMDDLKRLLLVAAVGGHHTFMVGPPGSGKTMMAERLPTILPDLTEDAALEVFSIHQLAGTLDYPTRRPPVRMPHHSLTQAGMIGGGNVLTPGEATLAHHGVLILDEVLEFHRTTLDALREPLVQRSIRLTRGGQSIVLPAAFQWIGTLNPCACGLYGFGDCRCTPSAVQKYWSRLSGALLDRVELFLHVQRRRTTTDSVGQTSLDLRQTVTTCRGELRRRYKELAQTGSDWRADFAKPAADTLRRIADTCDLSRRGYEALTRLARSFSIIDGTSNIRAEHVHEAWAHRPRAMTGQ